MTHPMFNMLDESFKDTIDQIKSSATRIQAAVDLRSIVKIAEDFGNEEKRLSNDRSLSAVGKSEALAAAATKARAELEKVLSRSPYDDAIKKVLAETPDNEFGDPILVQLVGAEYRQEIKPQLEGITKAQYEADITVGDTPLVRALETAPLPPKFVTDETRAVSRLARLAKSNPEKYQKIQDQNLAYQAWSGYAAAATSLLARY